MRPETNWNEFYEKAPMEPRPAVVRAVEFFRCNPPSEKTAIDLGCGNGRDTSLLLSEGWHVVAVDNEPEAFEFMKRNLDSDLLDEVEFVCMPFEKLVWRKAMLINAGYSLPFCSKEHFADVMKRIVMHLLPGGLFTANLFGDRDEWKDLSLITRQELMKIFDGFEMIHFEEEEVDGPTLLGPEKHWHMFHITALKK